MNTTSRLQLNTNTIMNSTSIPNEITGEKRVEDEFVENVDAGMNEAAYAPEYANYSQAKTIAVFWRSVVFASAMAVGAIFDCYALTGKSPPSSSHSMWRRHSLDGSSAAGNSLLANPGFVLVLAFPPASTMSSR